MMPRRGRSGVEGASGEEGASAVGDAFQQVAQGLGRLQEALRQQERVAERRLQEALRQQEQEAERRLQDALRLQEQRMTTVLGESMRGMEQKLQEKEDAIRALQQRLEVQERVASVDEGTMAWRAVVEGALQRLEDRMQKLEGSLQRALDQFFPRVEALLRHAEKPSLPGATRISSSTPTTAANAIGADAAGAREEERERQRVLLRMREAGQRRNRASDSPCLLGEDLCKEAKYGRLHDVRHLLDSGADVNYTNGAGWTPLMYACAHNGNVEMASLLLERGADVSAVNDYGYCALHFACRWNDYVPLLIRAGADVDTRDGSGATPLHWAAKKSNKAAARALVAAGARKDLKGWGGDIKGKTPFNFADSVALRELLRP